MQVQVLGAERRRRWSYAEKVRLVEETLQAGETVCGVARRHGMAQSLLFTWRRHARQGRLGGETVSALVPVEIASSCRDSFYAGGAGITVRTAATVFASCAARRGRNNRDRAWRLSGAR